MVQAPPIADPVLRAASTSTGRAPDGGWASLVPELTVTDIETSLSFWCGTLGFTVAYDRPNARFAYLQRDRLQIMLCERNGRWETGELEPPLGRGVNFEMRIESLAPLLESLRSATWSIYEGPTDAWYRVGDQQTGQREVLVQDPDGYLLRFTESLGIRAAGHA